MSHTITSPRANLQYAVLDMDGRPVSWHATRDAAERAIAKTERAIDRRYGGSAYSGHNVVHVRDGEARVERAAQFATTWRIVA